VTWKAFEKMLNIKSRTIAESELEEPYKAFK
jgi:hypothetical protein